jgi:hypothetical protein
MQLQKRKGACRPCSDWNCRDRDVSAISSSAMHGGHELPVKLLRNPNAQLETTMSKKLNITVIAATVAASMAFTPAAKAGNRGLGIGLGVLAVGVMAHQANQAAKARKAAEARAKMRAQAQARAAAARKQEIAAQKAAAAKAAAAEKAKDEAVATTTESNKATPSTYVAAPSSTAVLTQTDVAGSQAETAAAETVSGDASTIAAVTETAETPVAEKTVEKSQEPETCKRFVPALGVAVSVGC